MSLTTETTTFDIFRETGEQLSSTEVALKVIAQANSGVDIGDVTINNGAGVAAVNIQDGGNSITVDAVSWPLPTGAATLAEQQTQTASLSVMDDWDESDRAKVNPIVGQAGVQGASGVVTALTQRVVLATDVALPAGTNSIGQVTANAGTNLNTSALALESGGNLAAAAASLSVIDDWDESDRAKVNLIVGQTGVQGASGAVSANTQRVVLATDVALPTGTNSIGQVTANAGTNLNTSLLALESGGNLAASAASLSVLDDWDESDRAKVNPIVGQVGVQGNTGVVTALTQRVVLATDVALPTGTNTLGSVGVNGSSTVVSVTPTITASTYTADFQLGGLQTVTSAARTSGGTMVLHSVTVTDKAKQNASIDLYFFDSSPSLVSADFAAVDITDAVMASQCIGMLRVRGSGYSNLLNNSVTTERNVGITLDLTGTSSLFVVAKISNAATYTSTSDLTFKYAFLQD